MVFVSDRIFMRSTSKRNLWPHADLMIKLVFRTNIKWSILFRSFGRVLSKLLVHMSESMSWKEKSKSSDTSSWLTFSELWFQYLRSTYAVAINDATLTCRMSRELTTNGSSNGSGRYCILRTVVMSHRFDRKNNWILIYWPCLFVEEGIAQ